MATTIETAADFTAARLLDELATARARIEVETKRKNDEFNAITKPVAAQLAALERKYARKMGQLTEELQQAEQAAKQAVLAAGHTVTGAELQGVYNKGRVSWDAKLLEGLAVALPPIAAARKEGEPTVSIRTLKA